jgi:hypothetical protein
VDILYKDIVRTGPVHKSRREKRETSNREVNREGRRAGRKLEMGLNLKNLEIFLDAWVEVGGILATFIKKCMISGRRMANPEIIASATKRGRKSGRWKGVTEIRED